MPKNKQCCGNCAHWVPEKRSQTGSITYRTQDPVCTQIMAKGKPVTKYAKDKPCWLWRTQELTSEEVSK